MAMLAARVPIAPPMKLFRIFAAGALSYVAYRAWQQRRAGASSTAPAARDTGTRTAPHGDPVLVGESIDVEPVEYTGAQSSRSFGAP